ncbi:MAG: methyl-accepting chemotaxis protein [Xanthobacteraceae bacterium]|nr:MAG: methyl-accepting chemotaxis protein [Xanthobacteraceae bacterium]
MHFGFFKRGSAAAEPVAAPSQPAAAAAPPAAVDTDSGAAKEILDLLELDLMAMVRHVERAAVSVQQGAASTAGTLSAIRQRTEALTHHTRDARRTAEGFSHATDEFTRSARDIAAQVRNAGDLANQASAAADEASLNVNRLRESSAAIGNVINLISTIARQTALLALNSTIEAARAGTAGRGFAVVASEVKALAIQTQQATDEIKRKIETLQTDALSSTEAVHRITESINAIRPVFDTVNDAVEQQNATTINVTRNATTTAEFVMTVADGASEIDAATEEAARHGSAVTEAGNAVATFAEKLKSRCSVLLRQNELGDRRRSERLPCHLRVEIDRGGRTIIAEAYDISLGGMLLTGPGTQDLPVGETLKARVEEIGACTIRVIEKSQIGAQTEFVAQDKTLLTAVEEKIWSIREENSELVTRAMEAGNVIARIFNEALARGEISQDNLFDTEYAPVEGTNPVQYRTRFLDWIERALVDLNEKFGADDERLAFSAIVDRNGYLPVHRKKFSFPQRPGDVAWNTANARNRRIFDDRAGLAAARNIRTYLIQSYPRDMGNGVTVMMREIDVPIRVNGVHWGAFRTAYRL